MKKLAMLTVVAMVALMGCAPGEYQWGNYLIEVKARNVTLEAGPLILIQVSNGGAAVIVEGITFVPPNGEVPIKASAIDGIVYWEGEPIDLSISEIRIDFRTQLNDGATLEFQSLVEFPIFSYVYSSSSGMGYVTLNTAEFIVLETESGSSTAPPYPYDIIDNTVKTKMGETTFLFPLSSFLLHSQRKAYATWGKIRR